MSIKVSFCWFLWLQHLTLSFFQKPFEKLIRVKTPSKWRDADLKPRPLDRFRLYRAGYLHYLFLTRIPNKTQNIKWFLLCKCNGIYYDCKTVNRTFKIIGFICCTWTVSKKTSEKNTNEPFCLCTWCTDWTCNDLWILFAKFAKIANGWVHHKQWQAARIVLCYIWKRRL